MGCGTSNAAVQAQDPGTEEGKENGHTMGNGHSEGPGGDDLPTVTLSDTPAKPKPPIAFEIPLEEFESSKREGTPPAHLQRLLQPPAPDISLPDIEEKLAEAEQRRMSILQQRAASAQKRAQKLLQSATNKLERLDSEHGQDASKHGPNTLPIPPEPGVCEDKNI